VRKVALAVAGRQRSAIAAKEGGKKAPPPPPFRRARPRPAAWPASSLPKSGAAAAAPSHRLLRRNGAALAGRDGKRDRATAGARRTALFMSISSFSFVFILSRFAPARESRRPRNVTAAAWACRPVRRSPAASRCPLVPGTTHTWRNRRTPASYSTRSSMTKCPLNSRAGLSRYYMRGIGHDLSRARLLGQLLAAEHRATAARWRFMRALGHSAFAADCRPF